jgi:large-conductance mechanosensitive channel
MSNNYLGTAIINTTDNILNIQKDFSAFTAYNNLLIIIAAAVCIGFATREMITDIMNTVLLPLFLFLTERTLSVQLYKKIIEKSKSIPILTMIFIKFGEIVWIIFVWIIILWMTYLIFKKLIKIDLLTEKINVIQDITKYLTNQEKKHYITTYEK